MSQRSREESGVGIDATKVEGQDFLAPLRGACVRCTIRKRTSFGWVFEPCGLCVKQGAYGRFCERMAELDWVPMPKWGAKYLSGDAAGPLPAAWVVFQPKDGDSVMSAPGWVVRLLMLGNPMKAYVRSVGGIAVQWPRVFQLAAEDEEMRRAMDACILMSWEPASKGEASTAIAEKLYLFLLELNDSVFGGVAQENTQAKRVTTSKQEFGPPIRVLGKLVR